MQLLAGHTYSMEWHIKGMTTTYCPEDMDFGADTLKEGEGVVLKCVQGHGLFFPHLKMNSGARWTQIEMFDVPAFQGMPHVASYTPGEFDRYYISDEALSWP